MIADEITKAVASTVARFKSSPKTMKGRPEKAATVVTKLIDQDRVIGAKLGRTPREIPLRLHRKPRALRVPMISPSSTAPSVTEVGDYIFRVCFIDPFQGEVMPSSAANYTESQDTAAVMLDFNSPYSRV